MEPCAVIDKIVLHKHNCNIHFNKHLLPALLFSKSLLGNSYLNSYYFAWVWVNRFLCVSCVCVCVSVEVVVAV